MYCDHDDFIHDLAFDWYGNRLATCSSDQKIKVWDHINGKWSCTAEIKVRERKEREGVQRTYGLPGLVPPVF